MKKILLTYSGKVFSQGVFNFISELNERQPICVTGVFLPEILYANLWNDGSIPMPTYLPLLNREEEEMQDTMKEFEKTCRSHNIACRLHKDYTTLPQPEIRKDTRFADLLIVSSEKFYPSFVPDELNATLRDVLHSAECPVVIVPEKFQFPTKNIMFYDGSASSVYAIKQFAYLFPEFRDNETMLVYAKEEQDVHLPHESSIKALVGQHFKNLQLSRLHLNAKKDLKAWISEQENAMLVGGSFGRSGFSEALRKSFMHDLITTHQFPAFIAHK